MKGIFGEGKIKFVAVYLVLILSFYAMYRGVSPVKNGARQVVISELVAMNNADKIASVEMTSEYVRGVDKSGNKFKASYPVYYSPKLIDEFLKKGVVVDFIDPARERGEMGRFFSILGSILSWLPIIFMIWLMFGAFKGFGGGGKNQNNGGGGFFGGGPFAFGKNKAKMISPKDIKVTFNDVAGIDEAKEDLMEIVDFLKDPQKYQNIGGVIPKGCLLVGSPGTGKTLLAKAIAAEANVPFFFISGSDFVEMFVGVGASRVRDMFAQAKRNSPCIIFIDEIDAVGRHRGVGMGGGNDEREQTLNQLLVEMDGFEENNGIVLIAATNRPDVLDPALLRPGRFDRQVVVPLPDLEGRSAILRVHMKKIKMMPSIDARIIAKGAPGFSGAELANLVNEAALLAARRKKNIVTSDEFEEAKDKIIMGSARKMLMKQEERELTAYHEGGHALVAINMPNSDPIHKATIIPRGRALGMVVRLPDGDRFSTTRQKMHEDIAVAMAGRVAEEIIFGHDKVTSGASSDIKMVTNMARSMVTEWGLSELIGHVNYAEESKDLYLNGGKKQAYHCSEDTAKLIDQEVKQIIDTGYKTARKILEECIDDLHKIAKALLEFETITGSEIVDLIKNGKPIERIINKDVGRGRSIIGSVLADGSSK